MSKIAERVDRMRAARVFLIVLALFAASAALRSGLACFPKAISVRPDEIRYFEIARSLLRGDGTVVHGIRMDFDSILYPLFLVPFMLIGDQTLRITLISVASSIVVSSTVIPAFLLAKRMLRRNSLALALAAAVAVLPDLAMSATFMSESLFYPVCAWLIYAVFLFWDTAEPRRKLLYCAASAVLCFAAYLVKIVAFYFIFAFFAALVADCLITKNNAPGANKRYAGLFAAICGGLIAAYKLSFYAIWGFGSITYGGNMQLSVHDVGTAAYFFYALLFNAAFALVAFFYFPVVMPVFRFKNLTGSERSLLVFAIAALAAMLAIITFSISLNEDYPSAYMRQHTRYYAPLLIAFLALFLRCRPGADDSRPGGGWRTFAAAFTVAFCTLALFLMRFFKNVCIDGVLLAAFASLGEKLAELAGDANVFSVTWPLILAKVLIAAFAAVFSALLLFRRKGPSRAAFRILAVVIVAVSIANNVFAMKEFYRIYGRSPEEIAQAVALNEFLSENAAGKNVLVISKGYALMLDTYLTMPVFWAEKERLEDQAGESGVIDLSAQRIVSNYPFVEYPSLDHVDYIVTDLKVSLPLEYYERIDLDGVDSYRIYRSLDPSAIYLISA